MTRTPLRGTVVGTLVTALVQSSTATTVITVGLVNSGVISFTSSLGIIFGANFGTTVTSLLVALNLTAFAPVLILAGFILGIIGGKYKVFGRPLFYFGLVFFSLSMISSAMAPYRTDPQLIELVGMMDSVFLQIAFGFIITTIFQSSSVTTGIVVVMSQNSVITPAMAIPILLGANLGTPTTALLVATRMNTSAKRAAVAHFLFNFLGVLLFLPLLGPFTGFVESLGGSPGLQVANAHFIFNLTCCIVFLILIRPFEQLVRKVVPGTDEDIVFVPRYLRHPLPDTISEAFRMIEQEIIHLLDISDTLLKELHLLLVTPDKQSQQVSQLLKYATYLDDQISDAVLEISKQDFEQEDTVHIAGLARISKLSEVLADQTGDLYGIINQLQEKGISLSPESKVAINQTLVPCEKNLTILRQSFPGISDSADVAMRSQDEILREEMTRQYQQYLVRLSSGESPAGSTFSRVLFQVEGMTATIREIRKSSHLLRKV
jgi:phosphate:Na+ symporter